jgi:hypothetical protein
MDAPLFACIGLPGLLTIRKGDYKTGEPRAVKYFTPRHLPARGKQGIHGAVAFSAVLSGIKKLFLRVDPVYWILLAVLAVLYGPVLIGARSIFWGLPLLQFFPWREFAKQTVLDGFLPLWNPGLGMGAPLLANAQSALLYPPNWILLIVPVEYGQGLLMVAHLLWAGIGMVKLSRRLGIGRLGQAVAGLAFMLSGYLAARAWFLTVNASAAWLPWIILAGEDSIRRGKGLFSVPLTAALCLQWLAGHWQTAWYTWLILAGWMATRAFSRRPAWKHALAAGLRLLACSLFAFALGAVQFLPTVGYWWHSQRSAGTDPAAALSYSFWPWHLITLIAPGFFGNPVHGDYWGFANYWEDAVYIGLWPAGLACLAVWHKFHRKGIDGFPYGYLLALLPLSLVLALGVNTPVFPFLYQSVPTFNLFQAPARIMIGFVFALCLLAAAGAEAWVRLEETSWKNAAGVANVASGALAAGVVVGFIPSIPHSFSVSFAVAGGIGLLIAGLWFLKIYSRNRPLLKKIWPAAAAALVALDLAAADAGLVPTTSPSLYRAENPIAAEIAARLDGRRIFMPKDVQYRLMFERVTLFRSFAGLADWMDIRSWVMPNTGMIDGIPSADNYDPFVFGRYQNLVDGLKELPAAQRDRLLRMMDVGAVWEWPEDAENPSLRYLPSGASRAWGVCRAEWAISPEDAWQAVIDPQFDPARSVILELGGGTEGRDCPSEPEVSIAEGGDPNVLRVEVDFPVGGYLVLADMNDQGWEAFVDGERVPVLQADYAFRAVRVPAGRHIVEFRYAPLAFWVGAIATGLLLLILSAVAAYRIVRRPARGDLPAPAAAEGPSA